MEDKNLKISIEDKEGLSAPDPSFKLGASHYHILNEARKNDGIFDKHKYAREISIKNLGETMKKNMIRWNDTLTRNMEAAGYLIDSGGGKYTVNPLIDIINRASEFSLGVNHIKLLKKHSDGTIKVLDLKKEHSLKKEYEAKRQYVMIEGMIKNLYKNGYLERVGRGEYKLTDPAYEAIGKADRRRPAGPENAGHSKSKFKITGFDRHILEVIDDRGMIDSEKLRLHPKSKSISLRIETLKGAGLIAGGRVSDDLLERIDRILLFIKDKQLTLDKMTPEQLALLKDIRLFLNLSYSQITRYIYRENRALASADLDFLVKNKVIKRDEDMAVYVFNYQGIRLSNLLERDDAVRYKTKLYSRKEEVEHDMLVYTAYKEFLKTLPEGAEIISIKNDRQMRSDDAKLFGHMKDGYPDLRIEYKLPGGPTTKIYDIEIDCGYDGKTILSKLHNISKGHEAIGKKVTGFGWYCSNLGQALKFLKIVSKDSTRRVTKSKKIDVFVIGKDGQLHKIRV